MLKIVDDEWQFLDPLTLILDDEFLKAIKKGKRLQLQNLNDGAQFFIEVLNNKKPRKNDIIPVPFRRSIYARGYQCYLTHENGKAKILFDENNWITFDIVNFAL